MGPPSRSSTASTRLPTSSLSPRPRRGFRDSQSLLVSSPPSGVHGGVARQLHASCKERTLVHTPLPGRGALSGRHLQDFGAHLGRHRAAREAHVGRHIQEHGTHLGSPWGSPGETPPRARAHLGRHPSRAGHTGTPRGALVAEHPLPHLLVRADPEHLREGPEQTAAPDMSVTLGGLPPLALLEASTAPGHQASSPATTPSRPDS